MADIRKRAVIEIAEIIDPSPWIRMRHGLDTPRFERRRLRSIARAKSVLLEIARRKPEWRAGLTEMLLMNDSGRIEQISSAGETA